MDNKLHGPTFKEKQKREIEIRKILVAIAGLTKHSFHY